MPRLVGFCLACAAVVAGCGSSDQGNADGFGTDTTDSPASTATASTTSDSPASTSTTSASRGERVRPFFAVDFQQSPVGGYGDSQLQADWPRLEYSVTGGRTAIHQEGSNRFLRVTYPRGAVGPNDGGAQWVMDLDSNAADELYTSYRLRFPDGFQPVKGGKLPGLSGGARNAGGNKPDGSDGWSARIMWRRGAAAVQYVYHPDQPTAFGEDLEWDRVFPTGQWITVETRVRMNAPGRHNGIVQTWMDGELVLDRTDIRFRDVDSFAVDQFMFSTFFGGSTSDWAPVKDEYIDFDDFRISSSPISN